MDRRELMIQAAGGPRTDASPELVTAWAGRSRRYERERSANRRRNVAGSISPARPAPPGPEARRRAPTVDRPGRCPRRRLSPWDGSRDTRPRRGDPRRSFLASPSLRRPSRPSRGAPVLGRGGEADSQARSLAALVPGRRLLRRATTVGGPRVASRPGWRRRRLPAWPVATGPSCDVAASRGSSTNRRRWVPRAARCALDRSGGPLAWTA